MVASEQLIRIAKTNYGKGSNGLFSDVIVRDSVWFNSQIGFPVHLLYFEKVSSLSFEIGHSPFFVASLAHLLEFSYALDKFTAPRAQKRSLGRSLLNCLPINHVIQNSMSVSITSLPHNPDF